MTSNKRKNYDDKFKARVALEAVKGDLTIAEIVSKYKVHSTQVIKWKKKLISESYSVFNRKSAPEIHILKNEQESWLCRSLSEQSRNRELLKSKIRELYFNKHRQMAGSHLITMDLRDEIEYGNISRSRVAALMKEMNLYCKTQKKFVVTTNSKHNMPVAENILNRQFSADEPNQVFVSDITYLRVASHWVYLAVFIDIFSRKVVGWDLSHSLSSKSTCVALTKALIKNRHSKGMIIHSDRGIQYASNKFRNILKSINAVQSMSRKGDCWDNAVAESFFHTLKTRLTHHRKYETIQELQRDLFWYIEIYYNRVRKHSANEWMTPQKKEDIFYKNKKAA